MNKINHWIKLEKNNYSIVLFSHKFINKQKEMKKQRLIESVSRLFLNLVKFNDDSKNVEHGLKKYKTSWILPTNSFLFPLVKTDLMFQLTKRGEEYSFKNKYGSFVIFIKNGQIVYFNNHKGFNYYIYFNLKVFTILLGIKIPKFKTLKTLINRIKRGIHSKNDTMYSEVDSKIYEMLKEDPNKQWEFENVWNIKCKEKCLPPKRVRMIIDFAKTKDPKYFDSRFSLMNLYLVYQKCVEPQNPLMLHVWVERVLQNNAFFREIFRGNYSKVLLSTMIHYKRHTEVNGDYVNKNQTLKNRWFLHYITYELLMVHAKFNRLEKKLPGLEYWFPRPDISFEPIMIQKKVFIQEKKKWIFKKHNSSTGTLKAYEELRNPNNYIDFVNKNGDKVLQCLKYSTFGMFSEDSKYVPRRFVNQVVN